MTFLYVSLVGVPDVLDFDSERGELAVLSNRGKRIVLGMPKGLYPGYDREIYEICIYSLSEK